MEKNKKLILGILLTSILIAFLFFTFNFFSKNNYSNLNKNVTQKEANETYIRFQQNSEIKEINNLFRENKSDEAYTKLNVLLENEIDAQKQLILKFLIGSALVRIDKEEAANFHYGIYSDTNVANINRAYALLRMQQYAIAEKDLTYLKPFVNGGEYNSDYAQGAKKVLNIVNNKIYSLYPFAITAARLGRYELLESPSTTTAQAVFEKYKSPIEVGIKKIEEALPLRHLTSNTILNVAYFWAELEKYNVVSEKETQKLFENSIQAAKSYSGIESQQVAIISYVNYLANKKNFAKASEVFKEIALHTVTKNVENMIKDKKAYSGLVELSKQGSTYDTFFKTYGYKK